MATLLNVTIANGMAGTGYIAGLTPLEPQSRCGDKPLKFQVVCPQNGTAVLEGLTWTY